MSLRGPAVFLYSLQVRTRYAISKLQRDPSYIAKYTLAYQRMKALPASDPRSFVNQVRTNLSPVLDELLLVKVRQMFDSMPLYAMPASQDLLTETLS